MRLSMKSSTKQTLAVCEDFEEQQMPPTNASCPFHWQGRWKGRERTVSVTGQIPHPIFIAKNKRNTRKEEESSVDEAEVLFLRSKRILLAGGDMTTVEIVLDCALDGCGCWLPPNRLPALRHFNFPWFFSLIALISWALLRVFSGWVVWNNHLNFEATTNLPANHLRRVISLQLALLVEMPQDLQISFVPVSVPVSVQLAWCGGM